MAAQTNGDSPRHLRLYDEVSAPAYSSTGRMREIMMLRKGNARPGTAGLGLSRTYSKPGIQYKKEDLYDKVLQMKAEVNSVKQENVKLKTQLKHSRDKLTKPASDQPYLVSALKQQIEELKTSLHDKEAELTYIKKRSKMTKLMEMETEQKVTLDECTRLRRLLYEAMEELTQGVAPLDLQERFLEKKAAYRKLKREYFELTAFVNDKKQKTKPETKTKKTPSTSFVDLRMENTLLQQELKQLKDTPCPNCHSKAMEDSHGTKLLLIKVWNLLKIREMTIQQLWEKVDPEGVGAVKPHAVVRKLQEFGVQMSVWEVDKLLGMLGASQGETVYRPVLEETLELHRPLPSQDQELLLAHLKLKLQEMRLDASDIAGLLLLPEPQCSFDTLQERLMHSTLRFTKEVSDGLAKWLMTGYSLIPTNRLYNRFNESIGKIEVLNQEKEAKLDEELRVLFKGKKEALIAHLQAFDPRGLGWVSFGDFLQGLEAMNVSLSEELENYLQVLFYADKQELDRVPYETFAQAFCVMP